MTSRYIDINSSYRDRKTYPNICDFVIEMNTTQTNITSENARDPILNSFPYETNLIQGGSTTSQIVLSVESSNILKFYVNSYLEINNIFRIITDYNNITRVATVSTPFPVAYPALSQFTIRYEIPKVYDLTSTISPSFDSVVLSLTASSIDNFYVNNWIFIPGPTPPSTYQWFRIISYNGATKVAKVSGSFTSLIPALSLFEICPYTNDNVKPFKYFGTEIGTSNPVCSKISIVNLMLPNLPVANGYRGVLQNYPYLYVCLYSEKGITYNNPLISNTPSSAKALFKIPITYLVATSFLTLNSAGITQNVNFKINDDLRFQVLLPDGNPIQFDTGSVNLFNPLFPCISNPISQIHAVFNISQ